MKNKIVRFLLVGILMISCCFSLVACGSFEGFDDDDAIINGKSFSTTMSSTLQTNSKYTFKCKKSNGVERIKTITVPDNPVFDIDLTIQEGRFKVVLVKDDVVYVITDTDTDMPIETDFEAGAYELKIVAENAKVDFTFMFDSYN